MRVSDLLESEYQTVVNHYGGLRINLGPLEEKPVLLNTEPSL